MDKLLSLLSPFKWYLLAALAVWLSLAAYQVSVWREDSHTLRTERKQNAKLKVANDELQNSRDDIANRLHDALGVRPVCIAVQSNIKQAGSEHAGPNGAGISSDWLLEYAAQCETYRSERIALEQFLAN